MLEIIPPKKSVNIKTRVPTSKSYTNRALLLAALANGTSNIIDPLDSDDTKVMIQALKSLGIPIKKIFQKNNSTKACTTLIVNGQGGSFKKSKNTIYLGNAGTAVRFLTAALATQKSPIRLTGNKRMCERPISDLIKALKQWGAKIDSQKNNGCPPLNIKGPLKGGTTTVNGTISSQYLSALLMSAPYTEEKSKIQVKGKLTSLPYAEMTLDVIKKFGGKIKNNEFKNFEVKPHKYKATTYKVEGDASSASYPLAIAALTGGKTTITNIPEKSAQADLQFVKVLKKMGCKVATRKSTISITGPKGQKVLKALGEIDLNQMPDAAMTVAVLCAFANGTSILKGLGNLRVKETDRLAALKNELTKIGAKVEIGKTFIKIEGDPKKLHGATIKTYDDHRMAMCFGVVGSKIPGIIIENPGCVSKTYPNFWKDMKKWGISSRYPSKKKRPRNKISGGKNIAGQNLIYDFIIVGSGIAGLLSAINASKKGKVLLITKKKLENCNTYYAQGGIAAAMSKTDTTSKHITDTLKAGHNHNNRKAVEFIIKNAPAAIKKLEKLGVKFAKKKNKTFDLKLEGGHRENRIVFNKDTIGKHIEEVLISIIGKNKKIKVAEDTFAKDLIIKGKTCYGIQVISEQQKKLKIENYYGRRTILATGGIGQVFEKTTNPEVATGDGIAMAHRAGAKIKDMEFIQFHPTALDKKASPLFLLSETLRGEGAKILNNKFVRFLDKAHPLAELAPRDIISKEIFKQQKNGQVYLDLTSIPKHILVNKYPAIYKKLKEIKIDPTKKPIPITPAAHYCCGGISTNIKGNTNIKALYAFGETACTGLHGANRLASNSLLEGAVMSEIVADGPLLPKSDLEKNLLKSPFQYKKQANTAKYRKQIQKIMTTNIGIVRTKTSIKKAKIELNKIKKQLPQPTDIQSIETLNILTTAILITEAAIHRKKSLGTHIIT